MAKYKPKQEKSIKSWQRKRNYHRTYDQDGQVTANIITVDGVDVEVTEEVFLVYSQMERRERYLLEDMANKQKYESLKMTGNNNRIPETQGECRSAPHSPFFHFQPA